MRVERGISARKSRIQTISAALFAVIAGLVASFGAAFVGAFRRRREEEAFAIA